MDAATEIRFDGWTLCRATGELSKDGRRLRLQRRPLRVLLELIEHPGEVITRERLIALLWPKGVVDYDTSLNTAVYKLRSALGDVGAQPRYIETLPRLGYRWVLEEGMGAPIVQADAADQAANPHVPLEDAGTRAPRTRRRGLLLATGVAAIAVVCVALVGWMWLREPLPSVAPVVPSPAAASEELVGRARYFLQRRDRGDLERAERYLVEAVALRPDDAGAWAALASSLWLQFRADGADGDRVLLRMRAAVAQALALQPDQPEALLRLAMDRYCQGDEAGARRLVELAADKGKRDTLFLTVSASMAAASRDYERAIELERRAIATAPLGMVYRNQLVYWLEFAGRYPEAHLELERMRELRAPAYMTDVAELRLRLLEGMSERALLLADGLPDPPVRAAYRAMALHSLGRRDEARTELADAAILAQRDDWPLLTEAYAHLGEIAAARQLIAARSKGRCSGKNSVELRSRFLAPLEIGPAGR
jgi:DNA-binding winged helix-turn-helix (wHTH) protein/Flp pilus assembly protein TadD